MEIIKSTALQFVPNSVRAPISALLDNLTTSRIKKIALLSISFLIVRKLIAARNHFLNFHRNIIPLMQRDGMALASLSKEMRDHPYVVLQAVRNNGLAFQFASDRLKKDLSIAAVAVGNNLQAAQYVSPEICSINGPQKLSVSRSELINFIQSLGYKSDKEGICFGLGMMAIQAILCDDLQTYAYRLNRIAILINLSKQPESDRNLMLSLDEKNELILAVENDVDLHAFLNGVDLHHNSADYPHLLSDSYDALGHKPLEKHLARIAPIIAPCQLQEEGGIAIAKDFTRIYDNTDTFELFLNQLENLFQEDEPSAIGLFTYNHMLAISYNGKSINGKSTWIIIDHGWVCIYYKETLAKYIYAVTAPNYNQTPCRPIRIVIFSNASDIQPLRAILNYRYPNLLDIPPLSEAQLKLVNDPLYQLLMLDNEVDLGMFQSALQQGMVLAVQNKDFSVFWKCFIRDSHIRAIDFVRIIIETVGIACLEQTDLSGQTCLLAAVEANKIPFVKLLLKAGAKHDHQDQNGKTPLEIALEKNYLELVQLLS